MGTLIVGATHGSFAAAGQVGEQTTPGITAASADFGLPLGTMTYTESISFIARKGSPSEARYIIGPNSRGPAQLMENLIKFQSDSGRHGTACRWNYRFIAFFKK